MTGKKKTKKAAKAANEDNTITAAGMTNKYLHKKIWRYFEKRGWFSGVITKAVTNEGVITYHARYEDDKEESHLLEKDVEKWCQYAEMDPLPKGPLALFEKLLASTKIPVLEAADGTRKSPSLSNAKNDIVVVDVNESLLPQEHDLSSPKLPAPSFDKNDEILLDSSDMNPVKGSDEASAEAQEKEVPHILNFDLDKEFISHSDHGHGVNEANDVDSNNISDAIVEHSAPGGTIGEAIASSNNPKLGFDNPYSGLHEINKINKEFRLSNAERLISIVNRGATTNIPAFKDTSKFVAPRLDFNNQGGQEPGNLFFCLAELLRKPKERFNSDGAISRGSVYLSSVQKHPGLFEKESDTKSLVYVHAFFSEIPASNNKSFFGFGNHIVVSVIDSSRSIFSDNGITSPVVIMNSRGIDQTALSDDAIMNFTQFEVHELRETLGKCDGDFVKWFNEGNPLLSAEQLRVVKRSSTSPLGEASIILIDVEKEALETIFDEPKDVGESKRKKSSKRASRGQVDDLSYSLINEDECIPTASSGNSREGRRKKSSRSSTSAEIEEYPSYSSSQDIQYPTCFPDSRGGGVTPSLVQQHQSRHDHQFYNQVVSQAPVIGISPNSIKIREDRAAYEAESRMKDQIIEVYKKHQEALGVEHQRAVQISENAATNFRSVFESTSFCVTRHRF